MISPVPLVIALLLPLWAPRMSVGLVAVCWSSALALAIICLDCSGEIRLCLSLMCVLIPNLWFRSYVHEGLPGRSPREERSGLLCAASAAACMGALLLLCAHTVAFGAEWLGATTALSLFELAMIYAALLSCLERSRLGWVLLDSMFLACICSESVFVILNGTLSSLVLSGWVAARSSNIESAIEADFGSSFTYLGVAVAMFGWVLPSGVYSIGS
jgi:hypothetical protein